MPDNSHGFLSAPLTASKPADVVISPDGTRLYAAMPTGRIYVYDLATRALVDNWGIGYRLGGLDVSPDGSFLMAVELRTIDYKPSGGGHDPRTTVTVYKVDTATGERSSHPFVIEGTASTFNDVAVLKDGTALLSHVMYGLPVRQLDTDTGEYSGNQAGYGGEGTFVTSVDRSRALFSPGNISDAPLYIFEAGAGQIHGRGGYRDDIQGYSHGIVAYSAGASLVVQHLYSAPSIGPIYTYLYVYDGALNFKFDLLSLHPEWADGRISGLVFSATGRSLFVLDDDTDSIVQLSTADWTAVRSFAVGSDIGNYADGDYGSRLLITPDSRYFTVVTAAGTRIVENDSLANDFTGTSAADFLSAGLADDEVSGGGGNDHLRGDAGADLLRGEAGDDRLEGGTGNDAMYGGEGNDELSGDEGSDKLFGDAGADTMTGGSGNDSYWVDDVADLVVEARNAGTDTVFSSVTFALGAQVENLRLTGDGAIGGSGNALANSLIGNGAANALNGGDGNDRLDGSAGGDAMAGGLGHDTYVVDNAGDTVSENGSSGTDSVESSIDYTLPTHVERLVLTGTAGIDGRGNSGANSITGNRGANLLNGGSGDDTIDAGAGNDMVYGSLGNDVMKGGTGLDRFLFNTALGSANVDKILDFDAPSDTIQLGRSVFTRAGANGTLNASAFHQGTAAADSSDRIVYDQAGGKIFYDSDGTGAAAQILFATVTAGTALTNADFVIYG